MSDTGNPEIQVLVGTGELEARVIIPKGIEPSSVEEPLIAQYARTAGVLITTDVNQRISSIVEQFKQNPREMDEVIALAVDPVVGENGRIEFVLGYDPLNIHANSPELPDVDDKTDYYNVANYLKVEADLQIATFIPATEGKDGMDVTGGTISATSGRRCEIIIDAGLTIEQDGKIITEVAGVLQLQENKLKVTNVLRVKEYVDFNTGNIVFEGSVEIKEGVRDCFVVKATENVTILGLIEAATIMCGGDFQCQRGMAARDRGNLIVDGSAQINFLNNVRGRIKGNLVVRNEMINCQFVIGGNLECERGAIVGGTTVITGMVNVETLGSNHDTSTTLILGVVPLISSKLLQVETMVKNLKIELTHFEDEQKELMEMGGKLNPRQQEKLTEIAFEISHHQQLIDACEYKRTLFKSQLAGGRSLDLQVNKIIYPKVSLRIHDQVVRFTESVRGPLKIFWGSNRRIQFRLGDGPIQDIREIAKRYETAA